MLSNFELEGQCQRLGIPLVGIFCKDELPKQRVPGSYIINMQDQFDSNGKQLQGSHWVSVIIEGKHACYFDSFGFNPPSDVQLFLKPFRPYAFSDKQIQNPTSEICGFYCLYFLYWMNHHKHIKSLSVRLDRFLSQFSDDYTKNKTLLERYIKPL